MLTDQEQSVVLDIGHWILESPSLEDMSYYITHLPEDHQYLLSYAVEFAANTLYSEKRRYFITGEAELFLSEVEEDDQLEFLGLLSRYSRRSVIQTIIKHYPTFNLTDFPADVATWSKSYLERFYTITEFAALPDSIAAKVYATSMLQIFDAKSFRVFFEKLRSLILKTAELDEQGIDLTQAESEEEEQTIAVLGFLPKEVIHRVAFSNDYLFKRTFYFKFFEVMVQIVALGGVEVVQQDMPLLDSALAEFYRRKYEDKIIVEFEARRLDRYHPDTYVASLAAVLNQAFSPAALEENTTQTLIQNHVSTLNDADREKFLRFLPNLIRQNMQLQLLVRPHNLDVLVTRLESVTNPVTLRELISGSGEVVEAPSSPEIFEKVMNNLYWLVKKYPPIDEDQLSRNLVQESVDTLMAQAQGEKNA